MTPPAIAQAEKTDAPSSKGTAAFHAALSDVTLFRNSLEAIAELITEGIFKASSDGITFSATDPTMVTLVDFKFYAKAFDEYKVEGAQSIAVNLDNMLSILKRARSGDKVTLEVEKGGNRLIITLKGQSTRRFTIPILELEETKPPEMKLDFPATIEVKPQILEDGIEDAAIITDTVVLAATASTFQMIAEGDLSKVELNLEKGATESLVKLLVRQSVKSKFSLDYLKKITRGAKLGDAAKIELGTDYPVRISFRKPNVAEISYILAPRVED